MSSLAPAVSESFHVKTNEIVALLCEMLCKVSVPFAIISVAVNIKHNAFSYSYLGRISICCHVYFLPILSRFEWNEVDFWELNEIEIDDAQSSMIRVTFLGPLLLKVLDGNWGAVSVPSFSVLSEHFVAENE